MFRLFFVSLNPAIVAELGDTNKGPKNNFGPFSVFYLLKHSAKSFSVFSLSESFCFVNKLIIGTIISPKSIANAPALMGEERENPRNVPPAPPNVKINICATVIPTPDAKLTQTAGFVIFFEKRP